MAAIRYMPELKSRAQQLRKTMTCQERRLWYGCLKEYGVQFRRQKQFGRFIVDFYCAKAKLVIELDGAFHHSEQGRAYDADRELYLEGLGLRVIRFDNADIDKHYIQVCEQIDRIVSVRLNAIDE